MAGAEIAENSEVNQSLAALLSNAGAIRAITEVVQGTLGPQGLDCMLVDQDGGLVVTNDGITILKTMDVNHPAARILISAVEQQEEQVGDGTTTASLIAGSLIAEGVSQAMKGVPVIKLIEGIKIGIAEVLGFLKGEVTILDDLNSSILERIALVAGRGHYDLAELVIKAARILGGVRLKEPGFKLADQVFSWEGFENELFLGTVIDREPLQREMPRRIGEGKIIILDDALEPVQINSEALNNEAGFKQQLHNDLELREIIRKLAGLDVKAIFTGRGITDQAGDLLTDLGMLGVQKVAMREWVRLAEVSGARPLKRDSLAKPAWELERMTGEVAGILVDEKYKLIKVQGKPGHKLVTIIVGAYTKEVVGERERIAKDTASAVQAAWCYGVVPGGGSVEVGLARKLNRAQARGMVSYGYQCVVEALKRPLSQICANAGFNPLEKVAEVIEGQELNGSSSLGVNCETGSVEDLTKIGIWDPYQVKLCAIKSAGEVAEAILRINTIIKMKEEKNFSMGSGGYHD